MDKVYQLKREFVENELKACLLAAKCGVEDLTYTQETYGEYVTIHFVGGGKRRCNVSGDSCLAIIEDVLKQGQF